MSAITPTRGPNGLIGPDGAAGTAGAAGPTGGIGPTGATGGAGPTGATGPAGPTGATGSTGLPGLPGATGATGAAGATGPAGTNGTTGATGPASPSVCTWQKDAADAAASTATAEVVFFRNATALPITLTALDFVPSALLTANATNFATLTVRKRDGLGGAAVVVATLVTTVVGGSWAAFTSKSLGGIANGVLAPGAVLTIQITKTGTGVIVPSGLLSGSS